MKTKSYWKLEKRNGETLTDVFGNDLIFDTKEDAEECIEELEHVGFEYSPVEYCKDYEW